MKKVICALIFFVQTAYAIDKKDCRFYAPNQRKTKPDCCEQPYRSEFYKQRCDFDKEMERIDRERAELLRNEKRSYDGSQKHK